MTQKDTCLDFYIGLIHVISVFGLFATPQLLICESNLYYDSSLLFYGINTIFVLLFIIDILFCAALYSLYFYIYMY